MPIHFDYETDTLYLKGNEKGNEKGREEGREEATAKKDYTFVSNLLLNTDFSDEKIANLADVALVYVQKVKSELFDKFIIH